MPLLIYFSINWDSKKIIDGLTVEGNEYVPQKVIRALLADTLYKKEKGKIELSKIRRTIEDYPFVRKADVMFSSEDELKLILKMRKPVARFGNDRSGLHFTAEDGSIMPYLFFDNFSHLPLLRNCFTGNIIDSTKFGLALALLNNINEKYPITSGLLAEIVMNTDSTIALVLKRNNIKVIFNDTLKKKEKLDKLEIFMKKYLLTKHKREIGTIDLRWSRQVVVF